MGHVTCMTIEVVEAPVAGIETLYSDVIVADDLEPPGLGVVAARCPAGKIEDLEQRGALRHGAGPPGSCGAIAGGRSPGRGAGWDCGCPRAARCGRGDCDRRRTGSPRGQPGSCPGITGSSALPPPPRRHTAGRRRWWRGPSFRPG